MAKGEAPYDQAKAQEIFATYVDDRGEVPALFPDNSKTGGDTAALPKIWENKADFEGSWTSSARRQGGASVGQGPRQLQGRVRRGDQELRRLPRDLSREEELIPLLRIPKGGLAPPFGFSGAARRLDWRAGGPFVLRKLFAIAVVLAVIGLRRVLGRHHSGDGAGERAREPHAERRERQGDVLRGRLRLLPRDARTGRQDEARRRARAEVAVRHILCAEHLARSKRRHRQMERGGFRHRDAQGHVAGRAALFPGVSLHQLSAHEGRGRARPVRAHQDAARRAGQGARPRRAVPVQCAPLARRLEIPVPRRQAVPARRLERRGSGIAARTW